VEVRVAGGEGFEAEEVSCRRRKSNPEKPRLASDRIRPCAAAEPLQFHFLRSIHVSTIHSDALLGHVTARRISFDFTINAYLRTI
jgi:hypothetical protein